MTEFYLIVILILSVLAFLAYGRDKRKARRSRKRISEATLLGLGFFGGAVGALLGMAVFRHKTRHWYFWIINILGLIWQVFVFYFLKTGGF
ncbi:MAG: DUF1294 domain-containing protein [Clostridia bacterium]|nr:DUF1294 domain-containing protein [Clostridia bacterium]